MPWEELRIEVARRRVDRVAETLHALGAAGLQEDYLPGTAPPPRQPWDTGPLPPAPDVILLKAWFEDPDREAVAAMLASELEGKGTWHPVDDVDWEAQWRARFAPIQASARLCIAPPWDAPEGAIVIEPGQGFGTGQHPTTRGALVELDRLADQCRTCLDVGCGSGILAIAAARLGLEAEGIDIDAAAIADAEANAARNNVRIAVSTARAADSHPADLVLANLYAEALLAIADELVRLTGRWLVLAGVLADREDGVRARFGADLTLDARAVDGEWVTLTYRRPG